MLTLFGKVLPFTGTWQNPQGCSRCHFFYRKGHCFLPAYEGGPKQYFLLFYFRLLKIDELQNSNFLPEIKFQKPGCKALKLFLPRRPRRHIVVGEKFLYFFYLFLSCFGSRNDGKFLTGTDVNRSACWAILTEFCAPFFAVERVLDLGHCDLRGELFGLWVGNVLLGNLWTYLSSG